MSAAAVAVAGMFANNSPSAGAASLPTAGANAAAGVGASAVAGQGAGAAAAGVASNGGPAGSAPGAAAEGGPAGSAPGAASNGGPAGSTAGAAAEGGSVGSAAGASANGGASAAGGATFATVWDTIIQAKGCTTSYCHGQGQGQGGLSMSSKAEAYENLVGAKAAGPACGSSGKLRVKASDPAASLLLDKLSHAMPSCGDSMPIGAKLAPNCVSTTPTVCTTEAEIDLVKDWITAGAQDN